MKEDKEKNTYLNEDMEKDYETYGTPNTNSTRASRHKRSKFGDVLGIKNKVEKNNTEDDDLFDSYMKKLFNNKGKIGLIFGIIVIGLIILNIFSGGITSIKDNFKQSSIEKKITSFYTDKNMDYLDIQNYDNTEIKALKVKKGDILKESKKELIDIKLKEVELTYQIVNETNNLYESPVILKDKLEDNVGIKGDTTIDSIDKVNDKLSKVDIAKGDNTLVKEALEKAKKDLDTKNELEKEIDKYKEDRYISKGDYNSLKNSISKLNISSLSNKLKELDQYRDDYSESTTSSSSKKTSSISDDKKINVKDKESAQKEIDRLSNKRYGSTEVDKLKSDAAESYSYWDLLEIKNYHTENDADGSIRIVFDYLD